MAKNTNTTYRNQILYSVYVRNHTPEGTFQALRRDLPRIRELGTDILWLMPIHPIGVQNHKGSLGCPYANRDYRAVNPEYGTLDDFKALVADIHGLGMKCIIDVVYNHTSPDSRLAAEHPEWFYHKPDGSLGGRIGDWSDVVDLDYSQPGLWDYQIESLKFWASIVDGFRCDVASIVPLDFWLRARKEVETVRPGCIWLAETVFPQFITGVRAMGYDVHADCEVYQAFDICYDYDIFECFQAYLRGEIPLERYVEALQRQEYTYPGNYVKLRFLENHDQPRAAFAIPDEKARRAWTAFLYFQKGLTLLYGGQEREDAHLPSLFDKDPVDWSGKDISPYLKKLAAIRRDPLLEKGSYRLQALPGDVLRAEYAGEKRRLVGFFPLKGKGGLLPAGDLPEGRWPEKIGGGAVEAVKGHFSCPDEPVIFEVEIP